MKFIRYSLILSLLLSLVSCTNIERHTSDSIIEYFESTHCNFQNTCELLSSNNNYMDYLTTQSSDSMVIFSMNRITNISRISSYFANADSDSLVELCRKTNAHSIYYVKLNHITATGVVHPISCFEFNLSLQNTSDKDSCISFYYVISESDRDILSERPYIFFCGKTTPLNNTGFDGWFYLLQN